jgi:hypothetical protein
MTATPTATPTTVASIPTIAVTTTESTPTESIAAASIPTVVTDPTAAVAAAPTAVAGPTAAVAATPSAAIPTLASRPVAWLRRRVGTARTTRAETGMATAEYAIATVAAAGFAGLLVVILRSGEVRELLLGIIRSALSL